MDDKTRKKLKKEEEAIRESAKEMERREKQAAKEVKAIGGTAKPPMQNLLWTDRYAPQTLKEICGNKSQIEKLHAWLNSWQGSLQSGFKKPGKEGMNIYRAVMITGPPGIGKTTSAHLVAKLAGYTPIELNASDARSKKLVEVCGQVAEGCCCTHEPLEQHKHHEHVSGWLDDWWRREFPFVPDCIRSQYSPLGSDLENQRSGSDDH